MGVDLITVTFGELWLLVLKRMIYLVAKLISFKGLAFVVCCAFRANGIISGAVWCSTIIGIITNRTGRQLLEGRACAQGEENEETELEKDVARVRSSDRPRSGGTTTDGGRRRISESGSV